MYERNELNGDEDILAYEQHKLDEQYLDEQADREYDNDW